MTLFDANFDFAFSCSSLINLNKVEISRKDGFCIHLLARRLSMRGIVVIPVSSFLTIGLE